MINRIAAIKERGRKLGTPYEVWKLTKAKFAPGGDIAEMKMESELNALKLDKMKTRSISKTRLKESWQSTVVLFRTRERQLSRCAWARKTIPP